MIESRSHLIQLRDCPKLNRATLVLAFTGWMDGGDVSTGTVKRLVHLLEAEPVANIDPEPFYLYNVPGSMEIAALFRPQVEIEDGLIKSVEHAREHVLRPPSGKPGAVHRQGAQLALADVRRVRLGVCQSGRSPPHSVHRFVRRFQQ